MTGKAMKRIHQLLLILPVIGAFHVPTDAQNTGVQSEILAEIRQKAEITYRKYIGTESKRHIISMEYNSETGELLNRSEVIVIRSEYFHKRPENKALYFVKNGKELPPGEYNYRTRDPIYLPFDPVNGEKYDYRIIGKTEIGGTKCYEIQVIPREKTSRHFSGKIYFTANGLDLLYINGTIANYPIFVKELSISMHFKTLNGEPVASRGSFTIYVDLPIFFPNRKIVSSFTSSNENLLLKENDQ